MKSLLVESADQKTAFLSESPVLMRRNIPREEIVFLEQHAPKCFTSIYGLIRLPYVKSHLESEPHKSIVWL